MLRVLMLTPDIGSLDRRISQEAGTLARIGHLVDIYPVFDPLTASASRLPAGVRMLTRPDVAQGRRANAYVRGRQVKRLLRGVSRPVHHWMHVAQVLLIDTARLATTEAEAALLAGEPYDLVFAHDLPVLPLALGLKQRWGSLVICDLHEIYPEQHQIRAEWWTYRSLMRLQARDLPRADGVLCVNPAVLDYVRTQVVVDSPIGVVYNTVPYTARIDGGSRIKGIFAIETTARVLVFAGSLRPDANLDLLIRGFVAARIEGWVLVLLGSGPDEERLRRTVEELEAGSRVFLGHKVPQDELVNVLSSGDAGVIPYAAIDYNHFIATPNKLFEYIQARLPIVSSQLPEIARILAAHGNGITLDFSDTSTLAAGLRADLEGGLTGISLDALEKAAEQVCWEQDEKVLRQVFEATLERRTVRSDAGRSR